MTDSSHDDLPIRPTRNKQSRSPLSAIKPTIKGRNQSCGASLPIKHIHHKLTGLIAAKSASDLKRKDPQIPRENEGFEGVKAVELESTTYGLKVRCSTN